MPIIRWNIDRQEWLERLLIQMVGLGWGLIHCHFYFMSKHIIFDRIFQSLKIRSNISLVVGNLNKNERFRVSQTPSPRTYFSIVSQSDLIEIFLMIEYKTFPKVHFIIYSDLLDLFLIIKLFLSPKPPLDGIWPMERLKNIWDLETRLWCRNKWSAFYRFHI
jgi:hypothetical protein